MSWSDSGARTGPHEIGQIGKIGAKNDDDAARRIYRKYRMELFRFGVHVLRDRGLRSPAKPVRLKLNTVVCAEVVGDGALVAGHDGRGVADLVSEQGQGVVDAG